MTQEEEWLNVLLGGVTFYDNKDKSEFPNPKLGVKEIPDQVKYSGTGGDNYTAQTITEPGEGITVNIPYTADQRGYSHSTYIRLTNSSVMDDFKNALMTSCGCNSGNLHYDSSNGFCWGCTYDELVRVNFASFKFTPSSNCSVILKLSVNSSEIKDLDLKAGVEYTVTITSSQFVFKAQDKTRIIIQKVPQSDDFNNLDWTPPGTGGGDIEIPLTDPTMPEPEPNADNVGPEPDFPTPDIDPTGGEPEITIEPDVTPDTDPDIPVEPDVPEPDIPEPDITPDTDPDKLTDPEPDKPEPDPNDDEPEKPEDFD